MSNDEINTLLFCAFRYAIGRKSYIVADIAELLIKYKDVLDNNTKSLIKKEVAEAIASNSAGMVCDVDYWLKVKGEL